MDSFMPFSESVMGGAAVSGRILRVSYPSEPTAIDGECICNPVHLGPPFRCLETYLAGRPIAHGWRRGEAARLHVFPDTIGKLRFVFTPRNDLQYFCGYLGPPVVDCSRNNYWCAETCYYSLVPFSPIWTICRGCLHHTRSVATLAA